MLYFISRFEVAIHSIFAKYRDACLLGQKGLNSNRARPLPDLQIAVT